MKLKFKPQNTPPPPPPAGKPPASETKSMGKGMMAIAIILFLGMMTLFFQGQIEKQINPNIKVSSTRSDDGQIIIKLERNRAGHYVSSGKINGKAIRFLLDTGATNVAIPLKLSSKLGLEKGRRMTVSTANGKATAYQTMIDELKIGEITLYNVRALLTENLNEILLGMSALKQLEFTQSGNTLTIKQ